MKICSKEDYLAETKNRMLFRCNRREICTTLEDLNLYFESGAAEGKTDETLCQELESPEKMVQEILRERLARKESRPFPAAYLVCCGVLCILFLLALRYFSREYSCLAILLVPAFLWYSFGGFSLLQIREDTVRNHRGELLFLGISALFLLLHQGVSVCVYQGVNLPVLLVRAVYCLCYVLMAVTVFVLLAVIYRFCQGYYLSCGIMISATGTICSCLLGNDTLVNFTGSPSRSLLIGFLPFAAAAFLGVLCDFGIVRMREEKTWIRK